MRDDGDIHAAQCGDARRDQAGGGRRVVEVRRTRADDGGAQLAGQRLQLAGRAADQIKARSARAVQPRQLGGDRRGGAEDQHPPGPAARPGLCLRHGRQGNIARRVDTARTVEA